MFIAVHSLYAATTNWVIPAFAENVNGANGSKWQSEMRLTNMSPEASATVQFSRAMPQADAPCTLPPPITIKSGSTIVLRSVGCGSGTLAGAEIAVDEAVRVDVLLYETGDPLDAAVLTGVSTTIPITKPSEFGVGMRDVTNVLVNRSNQRVNVFVFGPPHVASTICIRTLDTQGQQLQVGAFFIPADRLFVLGDILSGAPWPSSPPWPSNPPMKPLPDAGAFTIAVGACYLSPLPTPPAPLALVSVVDNQTNDSTVFTSGQTSFAKQPRL